MSHAGRLGPERNSVILCAVDGSRHAQMALDMVRHAIVGPGDRVLLVHVVDLARFQPVKGMEPAARQAMEEAFRQAERRGLHLLVRSKASLTQEGIEAEAKLVRGYPAQAVTRTAARRKADLIVVGSRGLSDVKGFLMGSVARQVAATAPCPVLVVKRRVPAFERIVVSVDGSKPARASVRFLLRLPLPDLARITVVSVVPPFPFEAGHMDPDASLLDLVRKPLEEEAARIAAEAAAPIEQAGFEVAALVFHGNPSQEIVKLAEAKHADLVVIGSRGLTGTSRFLMGSVSEGVVKYAPCAVLVVRG